MKLFAPKLKKVKDLEADLNPIGEIIEANEKLWVELKNKISEKKSTLKDLESNAAADPAEVVAKKNSIAVLSSQSEANRAVTLRLTAKFKTLSAQRDALVQKIVGPLADILINAKTLPDVFGLLDPDHKLVKVLADTLAEFGQFETGARSPVGAGSASERLAQGRGRCLYGQRRRCAYGPSL